ncbi:MAG: enoyl-CoA hydratase/isomerase family protein [Pseudomonadota bacterium]|nr:enoyl-CoA hydratase/isomerase family protein [Pseudomonadota bacterium]
MDDVLKLEQDGEIAKITMDRPDMGNMLTLEMLDYMSALIIDAGCDPDIKVISIESTGENFCLGRDPQSAPEDTPKTGVEMREALTAPILGFYEAVRGADVPVVAAVQGRAAGFGCAAAAVCDVTVAADDARFSLPELKHDLPPTAAISAHIDRSMPKSVAWMVYSVEEVDAFTAQAAGFISHVVAASELHVMTRKILETITSRDRVALATCKTYLANARLMETPQASDYAANLLALVMSSKTV